MASTQPTRTKLIKIAVLGPRGSVGRAIIAELLKDGPDRFQITAITREGNTYTYVPPITTTASSSSAQPSTAPASAAEDVNIVNIQADFNSLPSLTAAFRSQDAVVNCITGSATQFDPTKLIIDAAVATGSVRFYVANEFVGDIHAEQYRRMPEAFVGGKVRTRKYLTQLAREGKMEWSALSGGPFFDMWLMKGPAGFDIANRRARIYGTGAAKLCWTPLPMMALGVANMLRWYGASGGEGGHDKSRFINKGVLVSGVHGLSQNAILAALEDMYSSPTSTSTSTSSSSSTSGGNVTEKTDKVFEVTPVDIAKINANARTALSRGEAGKAMKGLAVSAQFYEGDQGGDFTAKCDNDAVGVRSVSVETAIRDAIAAYGEDCAIVEGMYCIEPCEV